MADEGITGRLAELYDAIDDPDTAMQHLRRANRMKGAVFDVQHYAGLVDRLLKAFDRDAMSQAPRATHGDDRPVFIVGMPRSGTSLVEQILASHSRVFGAGELADMGLLALSTASGQGEYPETVRSLTSDQVERLAGIYRRRLDSLAPEARRVTDKMWQNFEHIGLIELLFPRARIIHCLRDPVDTGWSCYQQSFGTAGPPFAYDLANIGHYYCQYRRLMDHWQKVSRLQMTEVVYEDMVHDLEAESRRLVDFLELDWEEQCLRFYENPRIVRTASHAQVKRPVYESSIGRSANYASYLGPLKEALGEGGYYSD